MYNIQCTYLHSQSQTLMHITRPPISSDIGGHAYNHTHTHTQFVHIYACVFT